MEGKTHYVGGSVGAIVGFIVLNSNGVLLDNVHPVLQFGIIYSFGIYGGMLPDADHHSGSSPLKDPVGRVFNKVLHVFNKPYDTMDSVMPSGRKRKSFMFKLLSFLRCTHRSWQTHSELTIALLVFILYKLLNMDVASADVSIMLLMGTGLTLGVLSHLILDMLTCEGINFGIGKFIKIFFPKVPMITTIRLVPNIGIYTTGSPYELNVRSVLGVVQYFLLFYAILNMFGYVLVI